MALRLGKTVKELEAQLDSKELMDWVAFLRMDNTEDDKIRDPGTMEQAFRTFTAAHNNRLQAAQKVE